MKRIVCRFLLFVVTICLSNLSVGHATAHEMPKRLLGMAAQDSLAESSSTPINNLTAVTIQKEAEPFFTLIWKDSPKGGEATVDVYFYDEMGQRISMAMNKWDNSGWLDSSLSLCVYCPKRAMTISAIGDVDIPAGVTLFELVWHGTDVNGQVEDISTFGMIDPQLSWSLVDIQTHTVPNGSTSGWRLDTWDQDQPSTISMVSIALLILILMTMTVGAVGYGWWIGQISE